MPQSRNPNFAPPATPVIVDGRLQHEDSSLVSTSNLDRGYSNLKSKNLCPPLSNSNEQDKSLAILGAVGCTVEKGNPNLSLLTLETDTTVIENQSIFDNRGFSEIRNEEVSPTQQFVDTSDPFWELDDAPPRTIQERNKRLKESIEASQLAGDLAAYNLDSNATSTLPPFKTIANSPKEI